CARGLTHYYAMDFW
nr:immunoglobulin heavy chain junction region [Mus musculus]